ncbi:MAG TPA: NACHT domain-containing protein [Pyrinomonadaceae bacterium]|nr:NACHT domain-containing protein [Pyrinomonadaceae bacterium]
MNTFFVTFIACVAGAWSLTEATAFFHQDSLREALKNYWWLVFYVLPTLLALISVGLSTSTVFNAGKDSNKTDEARAEKVPDVEFEENIQTLFATLKEHYAKRLTQKLDEHFEITLEVSEDWDEHHPQKFDVRYDKSVKISEALKFINSSFDRNGRLLIVGNAGVGKTVLLLKFALERFDKTDLTSKEAFPVIFNLAAWSEKYEKFADWLSAMLYSVEQFPQKYAAQLLKDKRIIPLLDGLDELARNENEETKIQKRTACLTSLSDYLRGGRKVVICCRENEFARMPEATRQHTPVWAKVKILDLSKIQILSSLKEAHSQQTNVDYASANNLLKLIVKHEDDKRLQAFLKRANSDRTRRLKYQAQADLFLKTVINEKYENLLEVLSSPFFFSTALEVFDRPRFEGQDIPAERAQLEKYLMSEYINIKLNNTSPPRNFAPEQTRQWLQWLARLIDRKGVGAFELSLLQPTDVSKRLTYYLIVNYFPLLSGLFIILLLLPLFIPLYGIAIALILGLTVCGVLGLLSGLLDFLDFAVEKRFKHRTAEETAPLKFKMSRLFTAPFWTDALTAGLIRSSLFGVIFGLMVASYSKSILQSLFWGATTWLLGIISTGFTQQTKPRHVREFIDTEDFVKLDFAKLLNMSYWRNNLFKGLVWGLGGGIIFGLFLGLMIGVLEGLTTDTVVSSVIIGLLFGVPAGVGYGIQLSFESLKNHTKYVRIESPYQRFYGGFITNLIFVILTVSLALLLSFFYLEVRADGLFILYALLIGLPVMVVLETLFTHSLTKHFLLRIALYLEGVMPLRYATFLDYAADARILEKDGGQWRFRHQNLQEYFAQ